MSSICTSLNSSSDVCDDSSSEDQYHPSPILSPRPSLVIYQTQENMLNNTPQAPRPSLSSQCSPQDEIENVDWLLDLPYPMNPETAAFNKIMEEFDPYDSYPIQETADFHYTIMAVDEVLQHNRREYGGPLLDGIRFENITEPDTPSLWDTSILDDHVCFQKTSPIFRGREHADFSKPPPHKRSRVASDPIIDAETEAVLRDITKKITRDDDGRIPDTESNQTTVKQLFKTIVYHIKREINPVKYDVDDIQRRQMCTDVVNEVIEKVFDISIENELKVDCFETYLDNNYWRPLISSIVTHDESGNMIIGDKMRVFKKKGLINIGQCLLFLQNRKQ